MAAQSGLSFGGAVEGSTNSSNTQSATVQFIPRLTGDSSPPLVSPYPAGQGLATLNYALPGSAAFQPATYGAAAAAAAPASGSSSAELIGLVLLIGAAAWLLLR